MFTKESSKIGTFPETTIHDMVYFIAAYFQKKKTTNKTVFHVGISDAPLTNNQEMIMVATQQTNTCSESPTETIEKGVKYVQC